MARDQRGANLPTYPNLVKSVIPMRPNHIWVSGITYIMIEDPGSPQGYRFVFLTIVMDAYSRRILGWYVAPTLEAAYCIRALKMAIGTLPEGFSDTLIHHSDRGTQYASADYIKVLKGSRIVPSMTGDGNPKDNAMAERINNTVKNELLHGKTFTSIKQVTDAVRKAVGFYNEERPHSSIDMLTPNQAHQTEGKLKKHWHSYRDDATRGTAKSGCMRKKLYICNRKSRRRRQRRSRQPRLFSNHWGIEPR